MKKSSKDTKDTEDTKGIEDTKNTKKPWKAITVVLWIILLPWSSTYFLQNIPNAVRVIKEWITSVENSVIGNSVIGNSVCWVIVLVEIIITIWILRRLGKKLYYMCYKLSTEERLKSFADSKKLDKQYIDTKVHEKICVGLMDGLKFIIPAMALILTLISIVASAIGGNLVISLLQEIVPPILTIITMLIVSFLGLSFWAANIELNLLIIEKAKAEIEKKKENL